MKFNPMTCVNILEDCIKTKLYLRPEHTEQYDHFMQWAATSVPQVALLNQAPNTSGTYHVDVNALLGKLKLKTAANLFANKTPNIVISNRNVEVSVMSGTKAYIYVDGSALFAAYIFYHTIEGDFLTNLKNATKTQLTKKRFNKIPNPHLMKLYTDHSIEDANGILIIAFSYIAYILANVHHTAKKVTKRSKFYIEPSIIKSGIHEYTNSPKISKAKNIKLACLEISYEEIQSQDQLFTFVNSYNGDGVDDWLYFRSFAGDRWAVSPSLGFKRKLNISEFYNI